MYSAVHRRQQDADHVAPTPRKSKKGRAASSEADAADAGAAAARGTMPLPADEHAS